MSGCVRIMFHSGTAEWKADERAWFHLPPEERSQIEGTIPNIAEWEAFWSLKATEQLVIDARDLCFDGVPVRGIDWAFRKQRWIILHGRTVPADSVPNSYSIAPFEEGWILHDQILDEIMFLVAQCPSERCTNNPLLTDPRESARSPH